MTRVAGVDSSTQSCKVVIAEAETGEIVRSGQAPHPDGTETDPRAWWSAYETAAHRAGGLGDVAAIGVGGQQHGMICLDAHDEVVRPALLWNDTRSAGAAADLVAELGGPDAWAKAAGSVPVAAFTVAKLRWLADHEPDAAARTASVCLPHDYLTWRLTGNLVTDRGDASGTGYWSPAEDAYRPDLLRLALGREPAVPRVLAPAEPAGRTPDGTLVSAGTGDNMAAALGLGLRTGDVVVSLGTSGTVFAVAPQPSADPSGAVAGFADATGRFLPLVCTLNAARVLDAAARMLGVGHDELSRMALAAPPGADGLVLVPYIEGERTPNRPDATGSLHGLRPATATPAHLARAAVEGMLCGLADGLDAMRAHGVEARRVLLIGGGAQNPAVAPIAAQVLGAPVVVPRPGEYVAGGAAVQAAWALTGERPAWPLEIAAEHPADPRPAIREQYARG